MVSRVTSFAPHLSGRSGRPPLGFVPIPLFSFLGGAGEMNERTKDRGECNVSRPAWNMQTSAGVNSRCTCARLVGALVRSVEAENSLLQKCAQEK